VAAPSTLAAETRPGARDDANGAYEILVIEGGGLRSRPLPPGGAVVIGRGDDVDLRVDDAQVSRRHLRIARGEGITVEDLGSANGSLLRERPLEPQRPVVLWPGESVRAGAVVVLVVEAAAPAPAPAGGPMADVLALVDRAALAPINVLLLGETGVGKEVLARRLHARSPRATRPFVGVNCASLSEALLESELFGHERGAFTGAASAKPGLLETAPGGTVFLDEVGELPLALQAKLLRVLEAREVLRVGALQGRPIDVRFVAATNRDLPAEVARGGFRKDLFYRLNGLLLRVPPLRERRDEIPALAHAFASDAARLVGRPVRLSDAAVAALVAHDWPGNVRELRNAVERAAVVSPDGAIHAPHLPDEVRAQAPPAPLAAPPDEKARIEAALVAHAGNQSRAARTLGISRKVLIARLDEYGIPRPRKGRT
jgi:DNA-binding NtrC family response regulator